jgi:branched-chain amino acid transport system permease protein
VPATPPRPGGPLLWAGLGLAALILCPFLLPTYWTLVLTEILIMSLFALSFNLLFGTAGLLSFGQGGFFGLGAFAAALYLQAGGGSVWLALFLGSAAAALAALAVGYLCVRRDEIFFAMLTLGFGMMLFTIAHNWRAVTGGSDGLPLLGLPPLRLPGAAISLYSPVSLYLFTLAAGLLGTLLLWQVGRSPFGLILTAVRENKERFAFVGGRVQQVRLLAFVIAGGLAGLAGTLFCFFNSMATPDYLHWTFSAKPALMTILGGSGVFLGPAVGAAVFFLLEQIITEFTESWMIVLGSILIVVVLFFPKGITGLLAARRPRPPRPRP